MFTVELKAEAATAALTRASALLGDMKPVLDAIGELLVRSTKQRFGQGKAPDGTAWAAKSQTTLERYGSRKSNRVDIRPLFGPSGRLNQDIFHETGADFVEVGSSRIYAAAMQFGAAKGSFGAYSGVNKNGHAFAGSAPWGNIPARPFLGISSEDETNILAEIAQAISDALGN